MQKRSNLERLFINPTVVNYNVHRLGTMTAILTIIILLLLKHQEIGRFANSKQNYKFEHQDVR